MQDKYFIHDGPPSPTLPSRKESDGGFAPLLSASIFTHHDVKISDKKGGKPAETTAAVRLATSHPSNGPKPRSNRHAPTWGCETGESKSYQQKERKKEIARKKENS